MIGYRSPNQEVTVLVKEYLRLETDNACAICGCRETRALTIHHIDGNKKNNAYDNRIILCYNCHQRHNNTKSDITDKQIKDRKRRLITKTLSQWGMNALKLAQRRGHVVGAPFLLSHVVDLGFLKLDHEMEVYSAEGEKDVEVTCQYSITEKGKALLDHWFK